jgi:hypothetical protein
MHMHMLVELHGQPGWMAALTPLSVDGMIVAASTTLLSDSRSGRRGDVLPWTLLAIGSVASLTANVAVAEPTTAGRVIAAWPSFALIAAYELLMRQIRRNSSGGRAIAGFSPSSGENPPGRRLSSGEASDEGRPGRELQRHAWQWALANRASDGSLPSGREIARHYGRHERWGRLVKRSGRSGEFNGGESALQLAERRQLPNGTVPSDPHSTP